jgi:hypothetical protein
MMARFSRRPVRSRVIAVQLASQGKNSSGHRADRRRCAAKVELLADAAEDVLEQPAKVADEVAPGGSLRRVDRRQHLGVAAPAT